MTDSPLVHPLDELELALIARDDAETARVFADGLLARGDVRGEFAVLTQRGESGLARAWLANHAERLFGPWTHAVHHELSELKWSHGFLRGVTVARRRSDTPLGPLIEGLAALPVARLVTSFALEDAGPDALVALHAEPLGPRLVHLKVRARSAGALEPLGRDWPALTHLSVHSAEVPAIVERLAPSPTLRHLQSLALLTGFPDRDLGATLLTHATAFAHLRSLRVSLLTTDPTLPSLKRELPGLFVDDGWLT